MGKIDTQVQEAQTGRIVEPVEDTQPEVVEKVEVSPSDEIPANQDVLEIHDEDPKVEDRSVYNCGGCKGTGLDTKEQLCNQCLGTGKQS